MGIHEICVGRAGGRCSTFSSSLCRSPDTNRHIKDGRHYYQTLARNIILCLPNEHCTFAHPTPAYTSEQHPRRKKLIHISCNCNSMPLHAGAYKQISVIRKPQLRTNTQLRRHTDLAKQQATGDPEKAPPHRGHTRRARRLRNDHKCKSSSSPPKTSCSPIGRRSWFLPGPENQAKTL